MQRTISHDPACPSTLNHFEPNIGFTKREAIAKDLMAALISRTDIKGQNGYWQEIIKQASLKAVEAADTLIQALNGDL